MRGLSLLLLCGTMAWIVACSDDDTDADSGTPDQKVAQPDQKVIQPDKGADKATGDMSAADSVKADTIAFVKAMTTALPSAGSTKKVETFILGDNGVKGWVEDVSMGKGVESGYDKKAIEAIINGSHDPYESEGCEGFAKQDYKKGAYTMIVFMWQMKTAAGAKKMFDKNKKDGEDNAGITFKVITGVKDAAIIGDDKPQWKAYAHKGPYIFKIYASYL